MGGAQRIVGQGNDFVEYRSGGYMSFYVVKIHKMCSLGVSLKINCGLGLTTMCHCRPDPCNKCATLVGG